ncbi:hypothetical protein [Streptomyces melanogenes]
MGVFLRILRQSTWFAALSVSEQYAVAEEAVSGPAEHLAFQHLDPVDAAFDDAGTPERGEAGPDRADVARQTVGETVKFRDAAALGRVEPAVESLFALAVHEQLRDVLDKGPNGREVEAAGAEFLEQRPVRLGQSVGVGED